MQLTSVVNVIASAGNVSSNALPIEFAEASGVTSVTINEGDQSIEVGKTFGYSATVVTTGTASDAVSWSSSDTDIATVDSSGLVTGISEGSATITATSDFDTGVSDIVMVIIPSNPLIMTLVIGIPKVLPT